MAEHVELTRAIIGAAIEVHKQLGAGLLESTYEVCLCEELRLRGLRWERQVVLPIRYKGITVMDAYRIDILVEGSVIIEVKSVSDLTDLHEAQVLSYLHHANLKVALLINFNVPVLTDGLKRISN